LELQLALLKQEKEAKVSANGTKSNGTPAVASKHKRFNHACRNGDSYPNMWCSFKDSSSWNTKAANAADEAAKVKPIGESSGKPAGKAKVKPIGESSGKPAGKAKVKPAGKAKVKPAGKAKVKPIGESSPVAAGNSSPSSPSWDDQVREEEEENRAAEEAAAAK
jgi:hypothetical protein